MPYARLVNKHCVGININTKSELLHEIEGLPLKNNNFYWFLGRYLADGWYQDDARKNRKNSNVNKVFLCCSFAEQNEVEEKLKTLDLHYTIAKERTVIKFIFSNIKLMYFMKQFGKYAHDKMIPLSIQNLPIEQLEYFIDGYRSGDGCIITTENNLHSITTVSENIAYGFQNIIHKVYRLPCRINHQKRQTTTKIEGRTVNQRDTYTIRYRLEKTREHIDVIDGKMWFPIRKKNSYIQNDTQVYNIEVENDHTYTVQNLIAYNCQDYSVACSSNNAKGIVGKKGVLWWEIVRILEEKKDEAPEYLLLENVDRLLKSPSTQRGRDFAIILSSLNSLGYAVEWYAFNSGEYGMQQRRRRVFIFASKKGTESYNLLDSEDKVDVLNNKTIFSDNFPIWNLPHEEIFEGKLSDDLVEVTNNFNTTTPNKNAFFNIGYMVNGKYYTGQPKPKFDGVQRVLGDYLEPEVNIPEEFYINDEELKKWVYTKGPKSFPRTSKTGHTYTYSEGGMGFPDSLEKPSRTVITGEGGKASSRFKHVVEINGRHRRLVPIEIERLFGFPDNHTKGDGISDTKRAFLLGNALMTEVVEKIGITIAERLKLETNERY